MVVLNNIDVSSGLLVSRADKLFQHPVVDEIKSLDINTISPMRAFELLREMHDKIENRAAGEMPGTEALTDVYVPADGSRSPGLGGLKI